MGFHVGKHWKWGFYHEEIGDLMGFNNVVYGIIYTYDIII